jgi:pimeloyl-ACP methyl ester carboxylesterase
MAEDGALLLDHLHVPRAQVAGYSLGGIVALKLAAMHPDRVTALALGGMGWMRDGGGLQKIWEMLPMAQSSRVPPVCFHSVARLALTEEEVKAVRLPVKVIVGEDDPIRKMYVAPLEAARPDWPVTLIPDAGHISCITKPMFRDELVAWVSAHDAR